MSAPSYLGLLRENHDFRRLWLGVVVSFFGDWFTTVALYTAVQELSDSARAVAAVMIAKTLPIFLVSPVAGPLIDRFDRRRLLLATDFGRAALCLGLVAAWQAQSLGALIGVVVAQVALTGVFLPGRTAVVPQLTTEDELPVAMALSGGTWSVMLAFGAALGGLVTAWIGVTGSFVVDGATFLLSAFFLWGLPDLPPREAGDTGEPATFVDGLRYLRGRVYLPALLSLKAGLAVGTGALLTIPLYGNGLFAAAGPAYIGLLYASRGAGALVGSIGVRKLSGDSSASLQRWIVPFFVIMGLSFVAVSFAPSVGWAALGFFVAATGNGVVWVFSGILGQRAAPRAFRGRLFSMEFAAMTLVSASVSWLAGALVDAWGWSPRDVNVATGAAMFVPAVAWAIVLRFAPDLDEG